MENKHNDRKDYLNFLQMQMFEKSQKKINNKAQKTILHNDTATISTSNNINNTNINNNPVVSNIIWIPVIVPNGVNQSFLSIMGKEQQSINSNNPITNNELNENKQNAKQQSIKPLNNIENGFTFTDKNQPASSKQDYLNELKEQIEQKNKRLEDQRRKDKEFDKKHEERLNSTQ